MVKTIESIDKTLYIECNNINSRRFNKIDYGLTNKVAIICGAAGKGAGGTGFQIAKKLCENGAKVVFADLEPTGQQRANELAASAAETYFVQVDLGDEKSIKALMEKTISHFGKLDLLANCAFF